MRLRVLVAVLAAVAALAAAEPVDLVVMVDTSASMAPYFADVVDYFVADIMRGLLQDGDRFHLLSFAGLPEVEMRALRIDGTERQTLINKIRLLQPIGLYTDLVRAVLFLQDYTASVPASASRQIVLITDGVHDPPPGSPYAGDQAVAIARLLEGARSIRKNGWYVHILGLPLRPAGADGVEPRSLLDPLAREFGGGVLPYTGPGREHIVPAAAGLLELRWPAPLGKVGRSFAVPFGVSNNTSSDLSLTLVRVTQAGANLLLSPLEISVPAGRSATVTALVSVPVGLTPGSHAIPVRLETAGQARLYPLDGTLSITFDPAIAPRAVSPLPGDADAARPVDGAGQQPGAPGDRPATPGLRPAPDEPGRQPGSGVQGTQAQPPRVVGAGERLAAGAQKAASALQAATLAVGRAVAGIPFAILLPALLLLLALLLILLSGLRMARRGSLLAGRPVFRRAERGPLVEMQVSLQSSRIGFRNIRGIEPGRRRSVGGGWSAFLIFLVPLPHRIAEIRYEGGSYSFVVIRPRFFPGIPQVIPECLGVNIPLLSDKGFPVVLRFVRYISPLERIHGLLKAVYEQGVREIPGVQRQPPPVDTTDRFL